MDGGGVAVGGKVSVSLEIEAVLQKWPDPDGLPHRQPSPCCEQR
jgi:hypothetical protein